MVRATEILRDGSARNRPRRTVYGYAAQRGAHRTGRRPKDQAKLLQKPALKSQWGIRDHDTALSTLNALLEGMHAPDFDALLTHVVPALELPPEGRAEFLQTVATEYSPEVATILANSLAALDLPSTPKPLPASTYGWDLSRLGHLARVTVGVGYLKPEEVLPLLVEGAHRSRQVFSDWHEFGRSFVLGRALWVADDQPAEEVDKSNKEWGEYLDTLLTEPSSPWLRLPW